MKKLVLASMILALAASAAFAVAAPVSMKPGEAGFEEIPIGETQVGPYNVAAVYFQAVDMYPVGKGLSREESDMHLEADIHLKPEAAIAYGFGNGEDIWPAYLTVKYEIAKIDGKVVMDGSFMPMNADDGPHYGANIKMPTADTYSVKLTFHSPEENGYLIHLDDETGPGSNLDEYWGNGPMVLELPDVWDYVPQEW